MEIDMPDDFVKETTAMITEAMKKVSFKLYRKYGDRVSAQAVLHVYAAYANSMIYLTSDTEEQAEGFIRQAINHAKKSCAKCSCFKN